MISWRSIVLFNIRQNSSYVKLNVDCLVKHSVSQLENFGNITNSNVELNVNCRAQHSPKFCFRTSEAFIKVRKKAKIRNTYNKYHT